MANKPTKAWLASLVQSVEKTTRRPWWKEFPQSDRKGESPYDEADFAKIGQQLAAAAFVYRLTGDERLSKARDLAVALARFEKGGLSSPEYHGAPRKWPTQISEYLALCYDLFHEDLTLEQRKVILGSIDWRLRATYLEKYSWRSGDTAARSGPSVFCQSHPFENFMWSLPAVLLTAGDLEVSDELTPMCLNYLTGVTSAHGPDEAWNEGLAYGSWKGETMLHASLYTTLHAAENGTGQESRIPASGPVVSTPSSLGRAKALVRRLRGHAAAAPQHSAKQLPLSGLADRRGDVCLSMRGFVRRAGRPPFGTTVARPDGHRSVPLAKIL